MSKDKPTIWELLRAKYPANEYVLMAEVSNDAGYARSSSADYISVGLWPSRGLAINGIEVKSYRSDWLRELKKPAKAENIFKHCDYFWLLTKDETVAKIEEIPITWGWMCAKGNRLVIKKDAPKIEPLPLSKGFVVSMLRRAADKEQFVHISSIEDKINEAADRVKLENSYHFKNLEDAHNALKKNVLEFETASGVRISSRWDNQQKTGEAVKFVLSGGVENMENKLNDLKATAEQIVSHINQSLKIYEQDSKQN